MFALSVLCFLSFSSLNLQRLDLSSKMFPPICQLPNSYLNLLDNLYTEIGSICILCSSIEISCGEQSQIIFLN
uniref:Secreted protein n=1 Tax=Nelumbo nucifera TaxID=4432 RepID=A0A822XSB5_NELNU|nr:TPA_asm: hypothetical protein HUJ06_023178 [Nelumbo nucifera]